MDFLESDLIYFKNLLSLIPAKVDCLEEKIDNLLHCLENSEKALINSLNGELPKDCELNLEYALSRYILQTVFQQLLKRKMVNEYERLQIDTLIFVLGLDKTLIKLEIWKKICWGDKSNFVGGEGKIYGRGKYEQCDIRWASIVVYYLLLECGIIKKADFVKQENTAGIPVVSDNVKIAIIGDWGTGSYQNTNGLEPSTLVMCNIAKQNPDFVIHLGDVYYNGTTAHDLIFPNEEQKNFVDAWILPDNKSFALNSNHDMYPGGHGLFEVTLKNSSKFKLQKGATYFALVHKNWVLFGLDSAYYAQDCLFLKGVLIDQDQRNFIKGIDIHNKKVIVMTHHNALDVNGKTRVVYDEKTGASLWNDVYSALDGRDPDFWYWGHIHNAIAYSEKADVGSTIARCVGHGAIPFTKAPALYDLSTGRKNPEILYYAGEELPVQPDHGKVQLVKNGYAMLTITPNSLKEVFYDQEGNPVWMPPSYQF